MKNYLLLLILSLLFGNLSRSIWHQIEGKKCFPFHCHCATHFVDPQHIPTQFFVSKEERNLSMQLFHRSNLWALELCSCPFLYLVELQDAKMRTRTAPSIPKVVGP